MLIQRAQSDLVEFDGRLRAIALEDQAPRPFLCRGSPMGCDVFLVGINPGTDTPLWPHWSMEGGCDKDGWLAEYLSRHGRLKPTRARIERICEAVGRDRVLETNVFHVPSAREQQLARADRRTAVFDFLLETLQPRVMFVHGRSAVAVCEDRFGTPLSRAEFVRIRYAGATFDALAGHHLAYQWSYDRVEALGRRLRVRSDALVATGVGGPVTGADDPSKAKRTLTNGECDLYVWGEGPDRPAVLVRFGAALTVGDIERAKPLQALLSHLDLDEWEETG